MEFTVSQMGKMHGISRQTLIYYDKIGLFTPARVDEKGNRFYSPEQMPMLREICILKQLHVPLREIKRLLSGYNRESAKELLKKQIACVQEQQKSLQFMEKTLQCRLDLYTHADYDSPDGHKIFVEHIRERYGWFVPWPDEEMDKHRLHLCFAKATEQLRPWGVMPSFGIGAKILREGLSTSNPLREAGSVFFLPEEFKDKEGILTIPEGNYLCMNICGMPYRLSVIYDFWDKVLKHEVNTEGDLISACLLDSNFHSSDLKEDYCQLQIKISDNEEIFCQNLSKLPT